MLLLSDDPLEAPLPDFKEFSTDEPRMVHCRHPKYPALDAVYTFDVKIAQDRGLTFHHTCSFAIVLNNTTCEMHQKGCGDTDGFSIKDQRLLEQKANHCNHIRKQHGETRCVTTVTQHKSLSGIDLRVQGEPDHTTDDEKPKQNVL